MRLIQVTLTSTATPITTSKLYSPVLNIQNNTATVVRVGDNTVSATRGIALAAGTSPAPGGAITISRSDNRIPLFNYFLFGTSGQVIDIMYE